MTSKLFLGIVLVGTLILASNAHAKSRKFMDDARQDIEDAKKLPDNQPSPPSAPASHCQSPLSERPRGLLRTGEEQIIWRELCMLLRDDAEADRTFVKLKAEAERNGWRFENHAKTYMSTYRMLCKTGAARC